MTAIRSRVSAYMRLGRVSNLPTVCTGAVAGAALGGGSFTVAGLFGAALAMASFYTGGMFLNDAFDARIDGVERPERPIPSGEVGLVSAFLLGLGLLVLGGLSIGVLALLGIGRPSALIPAFILGSTIVVYDAWHKTNPMGPALMGLCRGLVYVTAALATGGSLSSVVWLAALGLACYIVVLTYVAKRERRDPTERADGPARSPVGAMIAGICLVDAVLVFASGSPVLALLCASGCPVTLALQARVAGT